MNDARNETVRFSMKPNPFFYALEFTWQSLIAFTVLGGFILFLQVFSSGSAIVLLLATYFFVGLTAFIVAFVAACNLTFLVTDKRAIIRFSFEQTTTDVFSIAIESVRGIEIKFCGARHGSVYLTYDRASPHENSEDSDPHDPQPGSMRRARNEARRVSIPIKITNSIWFNWVSLFGFYAFKDFDEFANIISEQQSS